MLTRGSKVVAAVELEREGTRSRGVQQAAEGPPDVKVLPETPEQGVKGEEDEVGHQRGGVRQGVPERGGGEVQQGGAAETRGVEVEVDEEVTRSIVQQAAGLTITTEDDLNREAARRAGLFEACPLHLPYLPAEGRQEKESEEGTGEVIPLLRKEG